MTEKSGMLKAYEEILKKNGKPKVKTYKKVFKKSKQVKIIININA